MWTTVSSTRRDLKQRGRMGVSKTEPGDTPPFRQSFIAIFASSSTKHMVTTRAKRKPSISCNRTILSSLHHQPQLHDSVVTLAFAFVTFTPNCFALATISTLFLDETECDILVLVSHTSRQCSEKWRRTLLRKSCYASGGGRHRKDYGRGRLCGLKASCGGFFCLSHSQSKLPCNDQPPIESFNLPLLLAPH